MFQIGTLKKLFIIYLAVSGLSYSTCGMWDLSLRRVSFSLVAHELSRTVAYGILVPWSGVNPMSPELEGRFLTTGPLGKYSQTGILLRVKGYPINHFAKLISHSYSTLSIFIFIGWIWNLCGATLWKTALLILLASIVPIFLFFGTTWFHLISILFSRLSLKYMSLY